MIAGEFRSRLLEAPKGQATRPTSDRLRETLFNVLGPRVEGSRFADLYAGSGAVGIEALSRGAEWVWFAEKAPPAAAAIRANLKTLGIAGGFALEDRGTGKLLASMLKSGRSAEIVYLDPPWEADAEYENTLGLLAGHQGALLADGAVVVVEHARKRPLAARYGGLSRGRVMEQGEAALSFYSAV